MSEQGAHIAGPGGVFIALPQCRYRYQRLNPEKREIRTLELVAGPEESPIQGKLTIRSLDEIRPDTFRDRRPETNFVWFAVSYVWGSRPRDCEIQIDGSLLRVTETLVKVLEYLRGISNAKTFWIDQICINQDDIEERGTQVSLMHEIYTKAFGTIAWLGLGSSSLKDSLCVIDAIAKSVAKWKGENRLLEEDEARKLCADGFTSLINPLMPTIDDVRAALDDIPTHISNLIASTWFDRVWTFQEAVLAAHLFFCSGFEGSPLLHWLELKEVIFLAQTAGIEGIEEPKIGMIVTMRDVVLDMTEGLSLYGRDIRLMNTDAFAAQRQTSDDRDMLYGQLGLFDHEVQQRLRPDYSLSVEGVFLNGTTAILEADQDLTMLESCCAEGDRKKYDLPSWCKDWTQDWLNCGTKYEYMWRIHDMSSPQPYHATLKTAPTIIYRPQDKCLKVRGLWVDTIQNLCLRPMSLRPDDRYLTERAYAEFMHFLQACDQRKRRAVFNAFLNGFQDPKSKTRAGLNDPTYTIYKCLDDKTDKWALPIVAFKEDSDANQEMEGFLQAMGTGMTCLFETKQGRIGKSCGHIRPGDKVCLLYGGRLPFLLREVWRERPSHSTETDGEDVRYKLIGGGCYVDGLVDGDGLRLAEEQEIAPQTFNIV